MSNLALQKMIYIAHMFHLGRTGEPLVLEDFEAWDYGPVIPRLYHHLKGFGNDPVRNVFHWIPAVSSDMEEFSVLEEVAEATKSATAGRLVSITHWNSGAWASCYRPGIHGIKIPNEAILEEYRERANVGRANQH